MIRSTAVVVFCLLVPFASGETQESDVNEDCELTQMRLPMVSKADQSKSKLQPLDVLDEKVVATKATDSPSALAASPANADVSMPVAAKAGKGTKMTDEFIQNDQELSVSQFVLKAGAVSGISQTMAQHILMAIGVLLLIALVFSCFLTRGPGQRYCDELNTLASLRIAECNAAEAGDVKQRIEEVKKRIESALNDAVAALPSAKDKVLTEEDSDAFFAQLKAANFPDSLGQVAVALTLVELRGKKAARDPLKAPKDAFSYTQSDALPVSGATTPSASRSGSRSPVRSQTPSIVFRQGAPDEPTKRISSRKVNTPAQAADHKKQEELVKEKVKAMLDIYRANKDGAQTKIDATLKRILRGQGDAKDPQPLDAETLVQILKQPESLNPMGFRPMLDAFGLNPAELATNIDQWPGRAAISESTARGSVAKPLGAF